MTACFGNGCVEFFVGVPVDWMAAGVVVLLTLGAFILGILTNETLSSRD